MRSRASVSFRFRRWRDINGRSERIRTSDPLVPNEVRYQAALHSEWPLIQAALLPRKRSARFFEKNREVSCRSGAEKQSRRFRTPDGCGPGRCDLAEKSRTAHRRNLGCALFTGSDLQFGGVNGEIVGQVRCLLWAELDVGERLAVTVLYLNRDLLIVLVGPRSDDRRSPRSLILFHGPASPYSIHTRVPSLRPAPTA